MSDSVTNELLLEHLKLIQTRLVNIERGQSDLKTSIIGIQQHMAGFMTSAAAQESALAQLQSRVERIERRLELGD